MNRWGKVLRSICEEAQEKGLDLYILEADENLNWYGVALSEICSEELLSKSDNDIFKVVKGKVSEKKSGGGFIAYVSPVNFHVDVYESDRRRFQNPGTKRPFSVTRDGFRMGFFDSKKMAVDFFLAVSKRLSQEGLSLHVFY